MLRRPAHAFPPWCAGRCRYARGQLRKDRLQLLHDLALAADHQTVATYRTPDAATGAHVHIMDALGLQFGGTTQIVLIIGVAAIDEAIASAQEWNQLRQQ